MAVVGAVYLRTYRLTDFVFLPRIHLGYHESTACHSALIGSSGQGSTLAPGRVPELLT